MPTRSNVQSNVSSLETRSQQLSPLTQQRNTQSAPPNIAQLSQGLQNLSAGDRSEGASGSTSSLTNQGSTTSQGTIASSGYGSGPQPAVSEGQQGAGQRNNLGAIREGIKYITIIVISLLLMLVNVYPKMLWITCIYDHIYMCKVGSLFLGKKLILKFIAYLLIKDM